MAERGTVTGVGARTGAVRWTRDGIPVDVEAVAGPRNREGTVNVGRI